MSADSRAASKRMTRALRAEDRAETAEAALLLAAQQNTRLSERLDRLEGALREIEEIARKAKIEQEGFTVDSLPAAPLHAAIHRFVLLRKKARAALTEEPYADVPGATS